MPESVGCAGKVDVDLHREEGEGFEEAGCRPRKEVGQVGVIKRWLADPWAPHAAHEAKGVRDDWGAGDVGAVSGGWETFGDIATKR